MKKIIFAALAAAVVALPSCSNDELVRGNQDPIVLNATAGKLSRGSATTTTSIREFKTWAKSSNNDAWFFDGVEVRGSSTEGWTYDPVRFWPQTATVDFYSVSPMTVTVNSTTPGALSIDNYVVSGEEDLLYSTTKDQTKKKEAVELNFRHALSQIVFKAKNTNASLNVHIEGIKVVNVMGEGKFTWATKTTTPYLSADNSSQTQNDDGTWGVWDLSGKTATKTYTPTAFAKTDLNGKVEEPQTLTADGSGALLLLPQTLTPWSTTNVNGSQLLINCRVVDKASNTQLWPAEGQNGEVVIALTAPEGNTWKQGKKYVYTLNFGEGAGWTPGSDPKPVLVQISLNVTVDEFQNGGDTPVNMDKETQNP